MLNPDRIPGELKSIPAWVVWRYEEQGNTIGKPSFNARAPSERAWPNDPETWSTFAQSLIACRNDPTLAGIGIVLHEDMGIVGVDLDHIDEWMGEAWRIVQLLNSYTELSPSSNGYRVFCYAHMPEGRRRRDRVEMYGSGRVFTVTGRSLGVNAHLQPRQEAVEDVFAEWLSD